MGVNIPSARDKWVGWRNKWDMIFTTCKVTSDYIKDANYYNVLGFRKKWGEFWVDKPENKYYWLVEDSDYWPDFSEIPNHQVYPYFPKRNVNGKWLGYFELWSVSLEWDNLNWLVVCTDLAGIPVFGIRIRDGLRLWEVDPDIVEP